LVIFPEKGRTYPKDGRRSLPALAHINRLAQANSNCNRPMQKKHPVRGRSFKGLDDVIQPLDLIASWVQIRVGDLRVMRQEATPLAWPRPDGQPRPGSQRSCKWWDGLGGGGIEPSACWLRII